MSTWLIIIVAPFLIAFFVWLVKDMNDYFDYYAQREHDEEMRVIHQVYSDHNERVANFNKNKEKEA